MVQINASVYIVFFILLCSSFNCTFPLHRDLKKSNSVVPFLDKKCKQKCSSLEKSNNLLDRTKKMVSNIEIALNKFKNSTQDLGKNIHEYVSKNEESFKQYEKLVMLKKYPYLDLKEFYLRFSPFAKRHDESDSESGPSRYIGRDASLWEPPEDCPNVEIINRGLSGFAIPIPKKQGEGKVNPAAAETKKKSSRQFLNSLRGEIERFGKEKKLIKNKDS